MDLAFVASPNKADTILLHGRPVVALSEDLSVKHYSIHMCTALSSMDGLHQALRLFSFYTELMHSQMPSLIQFTPADDELNSHSSDCPFILGICPWWIRLFFQEVPNVVIPGVVVLSLIYGENLLVRWRKLLVNNDWTHPDSGRDVYHGR